MYGKRSQKRTALTTKTLRTATSPNGFKGEAMETQIVTIKFRVPAEWDAGSFALEVGECFAEMNESEDSELVSWAGFTTDEEAEG